MMDGVECRTLVTGVLLLLIVGGCQKSAKVSEVGKSLKGGDVAVTVQNYQLRRLEVVEENQTYEYGDPVVAFRVKFKNTGDKPFRYSPTHSVEQMSESSTPMLYPAPGKKASLPPADKNPISGVVLEEGAVDGQITEPTEIQPGESVTDVMLFEVPSDKEMDLIFSLPPSMHGGSQPLLFRVPYAYEEPTVPKVYSKGETAQLDGVRFSVVSAETKYVEVEHTSEGKGYSSDPVYTVKYRISNKSDVGIEYEPGHDAVAGRRAPSLFAGDEAFARVRFGSNTSVTGQVDGKKKIASGDSIEDVSVFERPGQTVEEVRFEFPAWRIGRSGIVKYDLDYKYQTPDKPEPIAEDE